MIFKKQSIFLVAGFEPRPWAPLVEPDSQALDNEWPQKFDRGTSGGNRQVIQYS